MRQSWTFLILLYFLKSQNIHKGREAVDRLTGIFADGIGAAAATSGILTQLQGRIFGLLYLQPEPLSLDEITDELQQSKSNVSVQIRGLVDWQLVRQVRVAGSRKDHYAAATDFWRVMQEILERRFRWNLRQVLATVEEAEREVTAGRADKTAKRGTPDDFARGRLNAMRDYFLAVDAGLGAFSRGEPMAPEAMRDSVVSRIPIEEGSGPADLRQVKRGSPISRPRVRSRGADEDQEE
jgi:DNA-binding transcriptional regulator GbsR (MarR family)